MNKVSRRALADWAADQLLAGKPAKGVARHLAAVLAQNNMAGQIEFLVSDITWELEQRKALVVGKVTSAQPLSATAEKSLLAQLQKLTKATDVSLENNVDKSVLGGLRIETANHIWDQTISRKLAELREVF
jgi:ATP synthase F1 delta subunit